MENISSTHQPLKKWGGTINEFLWLCAGVNRKILLQCPTDWAKYAGQGGLILFTALMAVLSGGYAFYTIFDNVVFAIGFGIFWGLLIFNLDRFMVNTMYSDGKHSISASEFFAGLPRIILAIFLGIVISTPIELRIFADKIQAQLFMDQGIADNEIKSAHQTLYDEMQELKEARLRLEADKESLRSGGSSYDGIREKEQELERAEIRLYNETNGTGLTGRPGYGPAARQLQEQVDRLRGELNQMRSEALADKEKNRTYIDGEIAKLDIRIANLDKQIMEKQADIDKLDENRAKAKVALNGFTAQLNAMYEITDWSKSRTLFFARLMIMLLFVSIEIIPTLFKMMVAYGPYDDLLSAERHRIRIESQKAISDLNDSVNTQIQISSSKNQNKLAAEVAANKELLEKISIAQVEVMETAIQEWKEQELKKIKEDASRYIKASIG